MQVIFHAIDTIQMTVFIFKYSRDILEELRSVFLCHCSFTVLGAKDDLVEDLGVGTHKFSGSGFRLGLFAIGYIDGYSNLTPSGFINKTPKGSNVSNTVSYAVELPDA